MATMTFALPPLLLVSALSVSPSEGLSLNWPPVFAYREQNMFNPDLSVVFDFAARLTDSAVPPQRRAVVREVELGIASDVDPFLRAEIYLAVENELDEEGGGEEDHGSVVDIEEAFGIYSGFVGGLDIKLGKFAGALGRSNRNHRDALNFLSYPLVVSEVFGEEGLRAPGVSFSYLLPGDMFNEFTFEAVSPEEGPSLGEGNLARPLYIGHFRTFFDFSEDVSSQLGFSYGNGRNMAGGDSTFYGVDFVLKSQPAGTAGETTLESEAFWYDAGPGDGFGMFAALTHEVSPRVFLLGKYDYVELPDMTDTLQMYSAGITFKMTEFQHLRAEFQRMTSGNGEDRTQFVFQAQWVIGPHRAHKY